VPLYDEREVSSAGHAGPYIIYKIGDCGGPVELSFSRLQHDGAFTVGAAVAEGVAIPSPAIQEGSPRQRLERENGTRARAYRQQRFAAIAWVLLTPYGIGRGNQ
jgi:hypothetical protein